MEIKNHTEQITKVCSVENVLESWFDHRLCVFVNQWYNVSSGIQLRAGFEQNCSMREKYGAKYLVVDLSKAKGLPHPQEEGLFEGEVFAELEKGKFEQQIIIPPTNHFARFGLKDLLEMGNRLNCSFMLKNSLDEALEVIKAYHV
jgi:hypothetical protein